MVTLSKVAITVGAIAVGTAIIAGVLMKNKAPQKKFKEVQLATKAEDFDPVDSPEFFGIAEDKITRNQLSTSVAKRLATQPTAPIRTFEAPKSKPKNKGSFEKTDLLTLKHRLQKKRDSVKHLTKAMRRVRLNYRKDLKSDDEKLSLTALAVGMIDKTAERVGNEDSAKAGHFGITGMKCKHLTVNGNKITLEYVGKSGVDHVKSFSDADIAKMLKKRLKRCKAKSEPILLTSDGFHVKADKVNRYLADFDISAKDIRGYLANRYMTDHLEALEEVPDNERFRKKVFLREMRKVAKKVGHQAATLRKHYLMPEIETTWIAKGKIHNIGDN